MNANIEKKENHILIGINEEKLNSLVAPDLKTDLVKFNNEGYNNLVIDLSKVAFADSSGLSALLIANRLCKNSAGTFVIAAPQDSVKKLIQISQLDSILKVVPTVTEAVDLILMEEVERDIQGE